MAPRLTLSPPQTVLPSILVPRITLPPTFSHLPAVLALTEPPDLPYEDFGSSAPFADPYSPGLLWTLVLVLLKLDLMVGGRITLSPALSIP